MDVTQEQGGRSAEEAPGQVHNQDVVGSSSKTGEEVEPSATHKHKGADDARCCRICLDGEENADTGRLFSPCQCIGSMQFVHVSCLNSWRATAATHMSYFRCDACHYQYRFQRRRSVEEAVLPETFWQAFAVLILSLAPCIVGVICCCACPDLVTTALDKLGMALNVRGSSEEKPEILRGNASFMNTSFTFDLWCTGADGELLSCWDTLVPLVRVFAGGCILLPALGCAMFILRKLEQNLGELPHGHQHLLMMAAGVAHLGVVNHAALCGLGTVLGIGEVEEPPDVFDGDASEQPHGSSFTYSVLIDRKVGEAPGLDIDHIDGVAAVVVSIKTGGALERWNNEHPLKQIRCGDRIVEVNGARGNVQLLIQQFKTNPTWRMTVQRPVEVEVIIHKGSAATLGLALQFAPNSKSLLITDVVDGPMNDWNLVNPTHAVCVKDRIIEINGTRGKPQELIKASDDGKDTLRLVVAHYT